MIIQISASGCKEAHIKRGEKRLISEANAFQQSRKQGGAGCNAARSSRMMEK